MSYIGVYRALYEYSAQAEEELNLQPDDLLYLLERSDIDDWWKVKKRVLPSGNEEVEEPVGLVPSNYIEEAPVLKTAAALYDYDKQTEDELSFAEGEIFQVYDLNDPDWILVGDANKQSFGFVPSNYIDLNGQAQAPPPQTQPQQKQPVPISNFAPPPVHKDRTVSPEAEPFENHVPEPSSARPPAVQREVDVDGNDDEEEAPPPMPSRPVVAADKPVPELPPSGQNEREEDLHTGGQEHKFDGEFFTWYIDEVDGRKKRSVVFSIGQGMIIIRPNTTNNQWRIKDLIDFSHEKKHVFLEFKNPKTSIELHAGSKDVAEAIMSIVGDLKGAESARGLKEVARASHASTGENNRKMGRLMFDFEAQGDDELMSREGDEVYIINETKSKDWWMCENIDSGRQGVIPSSYIEIIGTSNLDKLTDGPQRRKSNKRSSTKGRVVDNNKEHSHHHHNRGREERDKIREKDRIQRDRKHTSSKDEQNDKSMPNYHRVRTWIDSSGSFKVEAEFLGCVEGKIHLHKTNGVKIAVSATKLSIEDLEYVEKVTGTSLETYKQEVNKQMLKRSKSNKSPSKSGTNEGSSGAINGSSGANGAMAVTKSHSATATINNITPPQPSRPKATTKVTTTSEPEYDWFEFFLQCGVDIGNCQRYTLNFNREQIDENILEDITPSLLRTLGLREGDILRVMKFLDNKFNRKKSTSEETAPTGGLFIDPNGALKNNSSSAEVSKPAPKEAVAPVGLTPSKQFEDDAWAVKPAARSTDDLLKPSSQPQTPQYTGSLQDLVNIKPLDSSNNASRPVPPKQVDGPSAPALAPVKTGTLIQPGQQFAVQKPISTQATGPLIPVQKTGLVPIPTGGLMTAQPTGFVPITAQPTGFIPIQATGILQPQLTFGITSFGQPVFVQATGPLPGQITGGLPQTSFNNQPLVPIQRTGPSVVPAQRTGGFVPQSAFGQQITGGFAANQPPPNTFSQQLTGGLPQTSFGNPTGGSLYNPVVQQQPVATFGGQTTGGFPQTSFGQPQQNGFSPFGQQQQQQPPQLQQATTFSSLPQPAFNQFAQQPQQTAFNQFGQQQPNMNQLSNMFQNTNIAPVNNFAQPQQTYPNTSFGVQPQPSFEGFNNQPLQSQPTGVGFGNAPLQTQQTGGRRANLSAATPDNPFGF
ncbi:SH3 domain protein involved in assembly of cortical actin cytoskeleton [Scheffersomyces stipitis CBS 6054]|uniref:Actin cytoskeleton-regulatory complex protein SLA1 n=1 Tax=Scheffersomyces stipitis (strain ATCC 58785 / CBS 6054 / NBRC 10063 / NRRL Y-11545) TaxID=322104 RepID=A3LRN7_PICST|nr:SH3 domain protein involved in assembly of cortical actin cytoskeleton [Scheffersomyces stipitis CBS 6054]ABN65767.2 SH3 domain protein involved in assembly of cortical actin cytoskeleton [Scheffersomyces stipitis CBS 6054]